MKVVIANDHRGVERKKEIIKFLEREGYEVIDAGANSSESVDYPIYAFEAAKLVANKKATFGILLCGTGIGMSIAANKVKGVRCGRVDSIKDTILTRQHNNANMIAISSNLNMLRTEKIIKTFLETEFSNDERHIRRNNMVDNYDC